ncbi:MAG: ATP-binding protein, partial [Schaedlerella sp.]
MGRIFNVSAACKPELHYMVNMDEQLKQIKAMVDQGLYFTINRARQYGKTTTLHALERLLQREYIVISLNFKMFRAA